MTDIPATIAPSDLVAGRYRVLGLLGQGGMASVLRARDEVLGRDVAVKVLHGHLADDPAFLDRFRREARAAAALSHPNVVAIFDWGEAEDGLSFTVLELVDGASMRDIMRANGRLDPGQALWLLEPAARGVSAAHRAGLVHRDVKPENILVSREDVVKVGDFGLARAAAESTQTFGGDRLVGTPHYLAPEIVQARPLDARADVYALGIVLYECLTGAAPFQGESPLATAMLHTTGTVPPPSREVPGISPELDEVVTTATARDPEDRYLDAGVFAAALRAAIPGGPEPVAFERSEEPGHHTAVMPVDGRETIIPSEALFPGSHDDHLQIIETDDDEDEPGATRGRRSGRRSRRRAAAVGAGGALGHDRDDRDLDRAFGDDDLDDEDELDEPRSRSRRGLKILLTLLVLGLLAGGAYGVWATVIAPVTAIPAVVGQPGDAARNQLEDAGFTVTVRDRRVFDVTIPEGAVAAQDPTGEARTGTAVALTLSLGPAPVDIPPLTGTLEEATGRLEGLGLKVTSREQFDEAVPAGQVIGTEPGAGTTVDEGSTVNVVISQGREPIAIPALAGESEKDAEAILAQGELVADVVDRVYSDKVGAGVVISQEPTPEATAFRGDTVQLVVSRGPKPFPMPSVRGQSEEEARATLSGLGLKVSVDYFDTIFGIRAGQVSDQDPPPGTEVKRGDQVILYVFR